MKLIESENKTVFSGINSTPIQYSIAQTAKVMKLLSQDLYSDHIKAVIRELSTNAVDSHIKANNTAKPPTLQLPTVTNPIFKLRDYGTGLSKESIQTIYTTYGASDKTSSNLLNGCMGIGSKSPFAYTTTFTTTSYYNGIKHTWVNTKDANGLPCILELTSTETTEPNGLEVSFAVDKKDIDAFFIKASEVLTWLDIKFDVASGKTVFACKSYDYYDIPNITHKFYKSINSSYVVMGGVQYPIEVKHFKIPGAPSWAGDNKYSRMLSIGLELKLPIGSVEFDISREKLQYTEYTIQNIKSEIDKVYDNLIKYVQDELSCHKSWFDINLYFYKNFASHKVYSILSNIQNNIGNIIFNAQLTDGDSIGSYSNLSNKRITKDEIDLKKDFAKYNDVLFFINDTSKNGKYIAIGNYISQNITPTRHNIKSYILTEQQFSNFCSTYKMGEHNAIRFSTIPKIKQQRTKSLVQSKPFIRVFNTNTFRTEYIEKVDGIEYYIHCERNKLHLYKMECSEDIFKSAIKFSKSYGIGIPKYIELLTDSKIKSTKLKPFDKYISSEITKQIANNPKLCSLYVNTFKCNSQYVSLLQVMELLKNNKLHNLPNSLYDKVFNITYTDKEKCGLHDSEICRIFNKLQIDIDKNNPHFKDCIELDGIFDQTYPLLKYIDIDIYNKDQIKCIKQYLFSTTKE